MTARPIVACQSQLPLVKVSAVSNFACDFLEKIIDVLVGLQRILRAEDGEKWRKRISLAIDRDLIFLHA